MKQVKILGVTAIIIALMWAAMVLGYAIQTKRKTTDTLFFHSYSPDSTTVKLIVKGDTLLYFHSENEIVARGKRATTYHVIYNPRKK